MKIFCLLKSTNDLWGPADDGEDTSGISKHKGVRCDTEA